jgi:hypothetical protein
MIVLACTTALLFGIEIGFRRPRPPMDSTLCLLPVAEPTTTAPHLFSGPGEKDQKAEAEDLDTLDDLDDLDDLDEDEWDEDDEFDDDEEIEDWEEEDELEEE